MNLINGDCMKKPDNAAEEIDLFNKSLSELSVPLRISWQEESKDYDYLSMRLFGHKAHRFSVETTQMPPVNLKTFPTLDDAKTAVFAKMVEANQDALSCFAKQFGINTDLT